MLFRQIIGFWDYFPGHYGHFSAGLCDSRKFGRSSHGIWGTNISLIVGIFAPIPFEFIIGAFLGAFLGKLLYNKRSEPSPESGSQFLFIRE